MGQRFDKEDPTWSGLSQRIHRALVILADHGIAAYQCACELCGDVRACPHPRAWTLGRPDASYRVDDERLVRHARAALKLAGVPPDPVLK